MSGVLVPEQVATLMPKVRGMKGIKPKIHNIYPVNFSAGTEARYDGLSQVVFNIPSFKGSWLNPTRSYLRYNFKSDSGCFPVDIVCPFERSQLRIGNQVVSDIQGVDVLQRILSNFEPVSKKFANANKTGDFRLQSKDGSAGVTGMNIGANCLAEIYTNGTTLEHPLIDPVIGRSFDGQEHYIPVGHFSGVSASAELTMWLNDPKEFLVRSDVGSLGFTLSDIELVLEVVEMPESINNKLTMALNNNGKVQIPISIYRLHNNHIPQNTQQAELTINESGHDVENVISVMRPQNRTAIVDYNGDDKFASNMFFLGGHGDRTKAEGDGDFNQTGSVKSIQWRYDTSLYPQRKLENGPRDNKNMLFHALNTLDKWDDDCFLGAMFRNATQWDYGGTFCLVNSFKTSRDDFLNGLNSTSTGAGIEMSLGLKKPAQVPLLVQSFCKSSYTLEIQKGGHTTIYNGAVKDSLD